MTKEIQKALGKYLVLQGHEAVCENFSHRFEYDVASMSKSGMLSEYEVKVSRADFKKDFNKGKRKGVTKFDMYSAPAIYDWHCPNFFSYVCPYGLIVVDEIPSFAGLYYFTDGEITLVRSPKRIHSSKRDIEKIKIKMLRMIVQRLYIGGTMMTYKNKVIKERNEKAHL